MEKHKQDSEVKMTIVLKKMWAQKTLSSYVNGPTPLANPFKSNGWEQWFLSLTIQVLQDLEGVFSIFDGHEFVGLIQKVRLEDSNLHIGRFLSTPRNRGKA